MDHCSKHLKCTNSYDHHSNYYYFYFINDKTVGQRQQLTSSRVHSEDTVEPGFKLTLCSYPHPHKWKEKTTGVGFQGMREGLGLAEHPLLIHGPLLNSDTGASSWFPGGLSSF